MQNLHSTTANAQPFFKHNNSRLNLTTNKQQNTD
jgi:hypothetical protein